MANSHCDLFQVLKNKHDKSKPVLFRDKSLQIHINILFFCYPIKWLRQNWDFRNLAKTTSCNTQNKSVRNAPRLQQKNYSCSYLISTKWNQSFFIVTLCYRHVTQSWSLGVVLTDLFWVLQDVAFSKLQKIQYCQRLLRLSIII